MNAITSRQIDTRIGVVKKARTEPAGETREDARYSAILGIQMIVADPDTRASRRESVALRPLLWIALLIAAMTALRCIFAAELELRTDEAYYWTWSKEATLSFLDHPPMIAWFIRFGTAIFGDTSFGVRFAGLLALPISHLLLADIVPEGLPAALDELCADVSTQHRVSCRFRDESAQARLPSGAANHLFRIAQEAIRNGIRHGAANQLEVRLLLQNDRLVLSIRDNGSGLLPAGQRGLGLGLRIMAHRARMIGAAFTIEGRPGAGTVVSCTLPLSNHA